MAFKRRDPSFTGIVRLPWGSADPCACKSGNLYGECCGVSGRAYKPVRFPIPPRPTTGIATTNCYMSSTSDCAPTLSGEHFVSASVLRVLSEKDVAVNGTPWLRGTRKALPIKRLVANILCARHNSAMSPLDETAGEFFSAVRRIYDDLGSPKTLSRKPQWFLFSGEELELWLVKTAFGLYHSGNVAKDGKKLCDTQEINPAMLQALLGRRIVQ